MARQPRGDILAYMLPILQRFDRLCIAATQMYTLTHAGRKHDVPCEARSTRSVHALARLTNPF